MIRSFSDIYVILWKYAHCRGLPNNVVNHVFLNEYRDVFRSFSNIYIYVLLYLQARCRGLPDDHVGPVRVLSIEGLDNTLCCGTHVSNLSHLQVFWYFYTPALLHNLFLPSIFPVQTIFGLLTRQKRLLDRQKQMVKLPEKYCMVW